MVWAAANVGDAAASTGSHPQPPTTRKSGETVEAALSRLSRAYSSVISCMGALHKLQHSSNNNNEEQSRQVANAARTTLERAILVDPLVADMVPTWRALVQELAQQRDGDNINNNDWSFVQKSRWEPVVLTSASHKTTVRDVAYVSLLNYADLLVACQKCTSVENTGGILENGVVKKLPLVGWEENETCQRLAVVALCDASRIDGTDPILWLKLACAARRLSRVLGKGDFTQPLHYLRLERHALEMGSIALPEGTPPNRSVLKALKEHNSLSEVVPQRLKEPSPASKLSLNLPRYSWSILGRMVMRACRQGCPLVELSISPMLVLTNRPLGTICLYLENEDVWKFEATCRGLAAAILAARASLERQAASEKQTKALAKSSSTTALQPSDEAVAPPENQNTSGEDPAPESRLGDILPVPNRASRSDSAGTRARSSKRVLSQLITSGKRADRESKRNSVKYCLLASTLHLCSDDDQFKQAGANHVDWDALIESALGPSLKATMNKANKQKSASYDAATMDPRLGDSGMTNFIQSWSCNNSGPFSVLEKYLAHISIYVAEVFESEQDLMALASFVIESVETLSKRTGENLSLDLCKYGAMDLREGHSDACLEFIAVNLLYAELRLKRSEGQTPDYYDFDSDTNFVARFVRMIFRHLHEAIEAHPQLASKPIWSTLKVRCHWLAVSHYIESSKYCAAVHEARTFEEMALSEIENTIHFLNESVAKMEIKTPHLTSPRRSGGHWKSLSIASLRAFRDDLQASSVVSGARQQFEEKLADIDARSCVDDVALLQGADLQVFRQIGESLVERYDVPLEGDSGKHQELLEDFVSACEKSLVVDSGRNGDSFDERWGALWLLLPSNQPNLASFMQIPYHSILSILSVCMGVSHDSKLSLVHLLSRLVCFSFEFLLLQNNSGVEKSTDDDFDDMSDDDMFSDDEMEEDVSHRRVMEGSSNDPQRKQTLIAIAAQFLIYKISDLVEHCLSNKERDTYINSADCVTLLSSSLAFISDWIARKTSRRSSFFSRPFDLQILLSTSCLMESLIGNMSRKESASDAEAAFFLGLCRILTDQRKMFPELLSAGNSSRAGRSARQKDFSARSDLIGAVLCEVSELLSNNPSLFRNRILTKSEVVRKLESPTEGIQGGLTSLVETLLYFWGNVSKQDQNSINAGVVLDRIFTESLLVPVGAAIIAVCGSMVSSIKPDHNDDKLHVSEFFDSDASINDYESEDEARPGGNDVLQPVSQAIQCVSLVVQSIEEKTILRYKSHRGQLNKKGQVFPLIASRVLCQFSDLLMVAFGDKQSEKDNLWQIHYPYRTRTIGILLDTALHKIFKLRYGFTLHGHWANQDRATDEKASSVGPESTNAAAQLYRCIQRAYNPSRKSAPKFALEVVSGALPPVEISPRRGIIDKFVFGTDIDSVSSPRAFSRMVSRERGWDDVCISCCDAVMKENMDGPGSEENEDAHMVRRGLARELALAPLPTISQAGFDNPKTTRQEDSSKVSEERATATFQEKELAKKFRAILEAMAYDDEVSNFQGWVKAAECCALKAEIVADRLGSTVGFLRSTDFGIPTDCRHRLTKLVTIGTLQETQERDYERNQAGWVPFIGNDLSLFVDYHWSSFESLQSLAKVMSTLYRPFAIQIMEKSIDAESAEYLGTHVWNEIETLMRDGDSIGWQQAWGSMFVAALRTIATRCRMMAFSLLDRGSREANEKASLESEILEGLGIGKYVELMGSQIYGYPMRVHTEHGKRQLAEAAQCCFQAAANKVADDDDQVTFDMLFMVGKCWEKIAKSFSNESFLQASTDADNLPIRQYERCMSIALKYYRKALDETLVLEDEGALPDAFAGGSAHGKTEVLYRLHASRLKCLIAAAKHGDDTASIAQEEGLRLTGEHWYDPSSKPPPESSISQGDLQWKILADIVAGLARCRLDETFFHRSVYRYAQALMWAPVFHDRAAGFVEGSLGVVPPSRSHLLRGLSSATPCANSAEVVITTLFEKKRPQLVAVWVTNNRSNPPPFEVINDSIRKFDSLRAKYMYAYCEVLKLCNRYGPVEALMLQVATTKRDLPAFYQASALVQGGVPNSLHIKDPLLHRARPFHTVGLLKDVKRNINRAMAYMLLVDLKTTKGRANNEMVKKCYSCYLRLNCSYKQIESMRAWKHNKTILPEAEALCDVFLLRPESENIEIKSTSWAGASRKVAILKAALSFCEELFPNLSTTIYRKSKPKKPTVTKKGAEKEAQDDMVKFVVDVPSGLAVGEKFETTVKLGNQMKTLRLTVPAGLPSKLQFSLKRPHEEGGEAQDEDTGKRSLNAQDFGTPAKKMKVETDPNTENAIAEDSNAVTRPET